jgi:hypothetical protein
MKEKLNDIVCESSSDYDILNEVYNYIEKLERENKKLKKVFIVSQNSDDSDMITNVLVVADNWEKAKELGVKAFQRDIFYDYFNTYPVIVKRLDLTREYVVTTY